MSEFQRQYTEVFKQFDPSYQAIFAAVNSRQMPSDKIPTQGAGQKSLAIAAFAQEMALAGLLYSQNQGLSISPETFSAVENGLRAVYAQAGFPNPEIAVQAAKQLASEKLNALANQSPQI